MILDGKFRKKEHLLKTGDFRSVYDKGRAVKTGAFVLCYLPNGLNYNRIGFSISSGAVKKASLRNRVRRLFKEAYRHNKRRFKPGFDFILIARRGTIAKKRYKDFELTLLELTNRAGVQT